MRPDAHKKKKNAQYKKKHGIGNANEENEEDSENQDEKNNSNQASAKPEDKRFQPKDQRQKKSPEDTDSSRNHVEQKKEAPTPITSNNTTDDAEDTRSQTFSRRKIVSNWNRYGDPTEEPSEPTDGKSQLRGADFASLVQLGANAASQFRMKEEKEWDLTLEPEINVNLLSLDCNSLVSRLQVLPLHHRLNIDEKAFDEETLQIFIEAASLNSGNPSKKFFTSFKPEPNNLLQALVDNIKADSNHEPNAVIPVEVIPSNAKITLPDNLDDELDSLLSLDIPTSTSKTSVTPKFSKSLDKREKISRPPRVSSTSVKPVKSVSKTESSDSYDWLDSILD